MTRPRGGITRNLLDRQLPHQVALSAESLRGAGHSAAIYGLAKTLAGALPPHRMERDGRDLVVFCFNRRAPMNLILRSANLQHRLQSVFSRDKAMPDYVILDNGVKVGRIQGHTLHGAHQWGWK